MTLVVLLFLVIGGFLSRSEWLPALHRLTASTGTSGSSQPPCPPAVAAAIPGGNHSTELAAYDSPEFKVILCRTSAGKIYYHGADRKNPKLQITLHAKPSRHGFKAHDNGYIYYVSKHQLVIMKNGAKVLDQPLKAIL